jgi:hypothetical protein
LLGPIQPGPARLLDSHFAAVSPTPLEQTRACRHRKLRPHGWRDGWLAYRVISDLPTTEKRKVAYREYLPGQYMLRRPALSPVGSTKIAVALGSWPLTDLPYLGWRRGGWGWAELLLSRSCSDRKLKRPCRMSGQHYAGTAHLVSCIALFSHVFASIVKRRSREAVRGGDACRRRTHHPAPPKHPHYLSRRP